MVEGTASQGINTWSVCSGNADTRLIVLANLPRLLRPDNVERQFFVKADGFYWDEKQ